MVSSRMSWNRVHRSQQKVFRLINEDSVSKPSLRVRVCARTRSTSVDGLNKIWFQDRSSKWAPLRGIAS